IPPELDDGPIERESGPGAGRGARAGPRPPRNIDPPRRRRITGQIAPALAVRIRPGAYVRAWVLQPGLVLGSGHNLDPGEAWPQPLQDRLAAIAGLLEGDE